MKDRKSTLAGQNIRQYRNICRCGRKLAKNQCRSSYKEDSGTGLDTHSGDPMTVLTSKHYSGHHKAAEEEDHPGTLAEEIWRRKC